MVIIEYIDHSYIKVTAKPAIEYNIADHFSFDTPNAHIIKYKKKLKHWDGKTRMYNRKTKLLRAGLIVPLCEFLNTHNIKYTIKNIPEYLAFDQHHYDNVSADIIDKTQHINEIYDYQYQAVKEAINLGRAIITSPTGSGKTLLIYILYRLLRVPTLLIVPNTNLVDQMYGDFQSYGWTESKYRKMYKIKYGEDKNPKITAHTIVIATWQSLMKIDPEFLKQFYCVIGDEAHGFEAKEVSRIVDNCTEAKWRFGTTATLKSDKIHQLYLQGLFGPVVKTKSLKELMDSDVLSDLQINIMSLDYCKEDRQHFWDTVQSYQDEVAYIIQNSQRNRLIINLALKAKQNTMILFRRTTKHGKILYDMLSKQATDRRVFYVDNSVKDRETVREAMKQYNNVIVVASIRIFGTGTNIPNLHNLILAASTKSEVLLLQLLGRSIRKAENKQLAMIYDIVDNFVEGKKINYGIKHLKERLEAYCEEQLKYKFFSIPIPRAAGSTANNSYLV